jgi:hypothetical protein
MDLLSQARRWHQTILGWNKIDVLTNIVENSFPYNVQYNFLNPNLFRKENFTIDEDTENALNIFIMQAEEMAKNREFMDTGEEERSLKRLKCMACNSRASRIEKNGNKIFCNSECQKKFYFFKK